MKKLFLLLALTVSSSIQADDFVTEYCNSLSKLAYFTVISRDSGLSYEAVKKTLPNSTEALLILDTIYARPKNIHAEVSKSTAKHLYDMVFNKCMTPD